MSTHDKKGPVRYVVVQATSRTRIRPHGAPRDLNFMQILNQITIESQVFHGYFHTHFAHTMFFARYELLPRFSNYYTWATYLRNYSKDFERDHVLHYC